MHRFVCSLLNIAIGIRLASKREGSRPRTKRIMKIKYNKLKPIVNANSVERERFLDRSSKVKYLLSFYDSRLNKYGLLFRFANSIDQFAVASMCGYLKNSNCNKMKKMYIKSISLKNMTFNLRT